MKRYNIYITQDQKQILNALKYTHHISYGTIINLIAAYYWLQPYTHNLLEIDTNIRKPNSTYKKTSTKIRNEYELSEKQLNNALQIYMLKMDKDPQDETFYPYIRNKLNHAFQEAFDEWFMYNEYCRMKKRFDKENK